MRRGRAAILDSAADRFAAAGLEELVGGVAGVRDVALAADVAPATVNHHFPPGGGRRNARLAAAALHHALVRRAEAAPDASSASLVAAEAEVAARFVALAAAPRSPAAVAALAAHHAAEADGYREAVVAALAAADRRPAPGLDVEDLALVLAAVTDGFLVHRRAEAPRATPALLDAAVAAALQGLSVPRTPTADPPP